MKQQPDEARLQFEAAARELVEANKRARAAGKNVTEEMHAAAQDLDNAQDKLKEAQSAQKPPFEPVALSETVRQKTTQTFAQQDRAEAMDLLVSECGRNLPFKADATPQSLEQVRLAILKLAGGNLDKLRRQLQRAKIDWRDVIAEAENPEAMSMGVVEFERLDEKSRTAIATRDRQQYLDWLNSRL